MGHHPTSEAPNTTREWGQTSWVQTPVSVNFIGATRLLRCRKNGYPAGGVQASLFQSFVSDRCANIEILDHLNTQSIPYVSASFHFTAYRAVPVQIEESTNLRRGRRGGQAEWYAVR